MRVHILTFARSEEHLFGNLLVFKTLRVGFPTAHVTVWDNDSDPACRKKIQLAAEKAGCHFETIGRCEHADWLADTVAESDEPIVFVDPDVVFWDEVEGWSFPEGTLAAGRYIPRVSWGQQALSEPRLHTSLLFIPDPQAIGKLTEGKKWLYDFRPWHGYITFENNLWRHWDTGSALFACAPDACFRFTERHLDAFDHLWGGTCLDYYADACDPEIAAFVAKTHEDARADIKSIKGLWKYQDAAFKRMAPDEQGKPPNVSKPSEVEMHQRWAQNNEDAAALIGFFGWATQLADDLVDMDRENVKTEEGRSSVMTQLLYTLLIRIPGNRFFREHEMHFVPLFVNGLVTWDASNTWANSSKKETRMFAYVMRESAGRLVEHVAYLVGGIEWSRQVAREIQNYYHGPNGVEPFDDWEAERRAKT